MKNLKTLGAVVVLTFVVAISAFAGETPTPPCAQPGQIESPPCASAQMSPDDSEVLGEVNSPPASNTGSEFSVSDVALSLLQSVLSLF
jgi:hypothetical protein